MTAAADPGRAGRAGAVGSLPLVGGLHGGKCQPMSIGELAGLIAALAFVLLVGFLGYPLYKLGKVFDETRVSVHDLSGGALPLLEEVTTTVSTTNAQLVRVDTITRNAVDVSENVSALTRLFAATLGSPVVKVAAFSYGVRQAFSVRSDRDRRRGRRG